MNSSDKIKYARLLYADFISDENEEKTLTNKLTEFGFTPIYSIGDAPTKFSTGKIADFLSKLQKVGKPHSELIDYVENIFFWIYNEDLLPLKAIVIEILLKADELQKLDKPDLEKKIRCLSLHLGYCFIEGHSADSCKEFCILDFSPKFISNSKLMNSVAEIVIEEENTVFDDFNKKLNLLENEISIKDMMEQRALKIGNDKEIPKSTVENISSTATKKRREKIDNIRSKIISMEPVSFLEGGFSCDQTIVRGYSDKTFLIGKIVQGALFDSPPLYLTIITKGGPEAPFINFDGRPALQFIGARGILDFTAGAGQIITLQLLNTWNRYVETKIEDIITGREQYGLGTKKDIDKTLEDMKSLVQIKGINEKMLFIYLGKLKDFANSSTKTHLYELPMPKDINVPVIVNSEEYGLDQYGKIISNLASSVLKHLDFNGKHIVDAISLRKSKIEVLKIDEDRKTSKKMLCLTYVIAGATIINVALFFLMLIK